MVRFSYKCMYFSSTSDTNSQFFTNTERPDKIARPFTVFHLLFTCPEQLLPEPVPLPEARPGVTQESCQLIYRERYEPLV